MLELKISWYINFTELLLLLYINLFFFFYQIRLYIRLYM